MKFNRCKFTNEQPHQQASLINKIGEALSEAKLSDLRAIARHLDKDGRRLIDLVGMELNDHRASESSLAMNRMSM